MSRPVLSEIGGILFDKDGTLTLYDESWAPVNREAARIAAAGDAELEPRLLDAVGMDPVTGHTHADSLLAAGNAAEIAAGFVAVGSPLGIGELTLLLDVLFVRATEFAVPATDLPLLFSRLKAGGLKLGIASSDNELSIRETAKRFGIANLVDFVAGYDSGFGTKPDPGMVLAFCAEAGLAPGRVAMVGDNARDLLMGASAGAGLRIGVLTGTGTRETLEPYADICIESIAALDGLLLRREAGLRG